MKRLVIGLLVAVPLVRPGGIAAQETPHPMYVVRQEFVKAAQLSDYETETRRWLADLGRTEVAHEVQWVTVFGPELGYSYVIPVDGFAGIDEVRRNLGISRSGAPARWSTREGDEPTPIDHVETLVLELRPDLSYLPRTVDLDLTLPFRKYHWYFLIPGLEDRFEDIAARMVELYGRHEIPQGFLCYEVLLGRELPVFLMVERARNEVDYAAQAARIAATVGDEADALFGQMLKLTRRIEVMEGMTRGDLSYPPLTAAQQTTGPEIEFDDLP